MELNSQLQAETRSPQSPTAVYRSLVAAVIKQAIDDVKGLCCDFHNHKDLAADRAMVFILSEDCKYYCSELEIDYETLQDKAISLYENYKENYKEQHKEQYVKKYKPIRLKTVSLGRLKSRLRALYKPAIKF